MRNKPDLDYYIDYMSELRAHTIRNVKKQVLPIIHDEDALGELEDAYAWLVSSSINTILAESDDSDVLGQIVEDLAQAMVHNAISDVVAAEIRKSGAEGRIS